MKSKDLRINNIVNRINRFGEKEILVIKGISFLGNVYDEDDSIFGIDELKPIPLTEEWLKKGGFIIHNSMFKKDRIGVENSLDPYHWSIRILQSETSSFFVVEIKYVHELQNAYKLLCGYELDFSEA